MILILTIVAWITRLISLYSTILVIYALLSWFPGAYESKFGRILSKICEPYLSMFSHLNLSFGPIDLTIVAAILLLQFANKGLLIIIQHLIFKV